MDNPVISATEAFLSIYNNLPPAIVSLLSLALALLFVAGIISLLWHIH